MRSSKPFAVAARPFQFECLVFDRGASRVDHNDPHAGPPLAWACMAVIANRVNDVGYGASPAEVVHRFIEPLEDRADCNSIGRTLDSLIGVVARCSGPEKMNTVAWPATSLPGSFVFATPASTAASYCMGLRSSDQDGGPSRSSQPPAPCPLQRLFPDSPVGIAEHRDKGIDAEHARSLRRADRDVRQLLRVWVRVDRAIPENEPRGRTDT